MQQVGSVPLFMSYGWVGSMGILMNPKQPNFNISPATVNDF
jgi:hypothetical protein